MWVDDTKLAVLAAVADQVSSVHQATGRLRVLDCLRNDRPARVAEPFEGVRGLALFDVTVRALVDQGLLRAEQHRKTGEALLGLSPDAVKVDGLDVPCLL